LADKRRNAMGKEDLEVIDNLLNTSSSGRILSMGMDKYVKDCYNGDKPPCRCACPVDLDITGFISKIEKGSFDSAYKMYREKAIFPAITSILCDQPCNNKCVRKDIDDSIDLLKLEKAVVEYALSKSPIKYNIPKKSEKIAVIGAGLCGLSCTLKLASRGYNVVVFEKSDKVGGRLWELLSPDIFLPEIENQMQHIDYELKLNTEISDIKELKKEFNAVLIATGKNGNDFGYLDGLNKDSLGSKEDGIFVAGSILGTTPMESIENGVRAAQSIENYLKISRMHEMQGIDVNRSSRLIVNTKDIEPVPGVKSEKYTKEEAKQEAGRCIKCDCTECMKACEMMKWFKKLPRKIVSDVRVTLNYVDKLAPRVATRLISSCSDCGCCAAVCTENIDMGEFLIETRRIMHREDSLPPVFHDFWIRDMKFADSEKAYVARNAPGYGKSKYVFFPGCQLGASDPDYVIKTYEYLLEKCPETGIIVSCCGIPAEWAGDEPLVKEKTEKLRNQFEEMGKPAAIMACPTCERMFRKYLPDIEMISLYDYIDKNGLPSGHAVGDKVVSVFDPCASKYDKSMQQSVRNLVEKTGLKNEELPWAGDTAQCCGNGGHIYSANPDLVNTIAEKRVSMSDNPYITYCTNCRDIFASRGKECRHILDILFGLNGENRKAPSLTQRRINREVLKNNLLKNIWKEPVAGMMPEKTKLIISDELTEKLNKLLILEDNIRATVEHSESTGNKAYDPQKDYYIGHLKQGYMTYWVMYKKEGEAYRIINAYCHRMTIEGE